MQLIYDGAHMEGVEVPLDEPAGGYIVAERGTPVEIPDDIAAGLLEQGWSVDADGNAVAVAPQWKKAESKAKLAPATAPAPASVTADTPKDGEN